MLNQAKENIVNGEKFIKVSADSKKYLGGGTYEHIGVHITDAGKNEGLKFQYPFFTKNGQLLSACSSIESEIIKGNMDLDIRTTTCF